MFCRREVEVIYFRIIPASSGSCLFSAARKAFENVLVECVDLVYSISAITSNPAAFSVTLFISYLLLQACLSLSSLQVFSNKIKS